MKTRNNHAILSVGSSLFLTALILAIERKLLSTTGAPEMRPAFLLPLPLSVLSAGYCLYALNKSESYWKMLPIIGLGVTLVGLFIVFVGFNFQYD